MKRKIFSILFALVLVLSFSLVTAVPAAAATTLTVTTNSDTDENFTIGASLAADKTDGNGLSLREALNWAVAGDTVTFNGGLSGQTVTLSGTQLTIDKDITLDGDLDNNGTPDIAISGNHTSRVIYTTGLTATARLEGLTIRDGMTTLPDLGGSGMFIRLGNSPTITNCIFTGNSGSVLRTHGVAHEGICYPTITNCIFTGNSAGEWSTIVVGWDSHPIITNCTFAGNTGGDLFLELDSDCTVNITNCIFWGNTGVITGSESQIVTYSDVQGGCTGTGNINTDPLFVNAAGGDFHLRPTSPCIDTGNNAAPGLQATDFEGDARIIDCYDDGTAIVDMGADEAYYPVPSEVWVDDGWSGSSPGYSVGGHTFSYDAFATIQDGIDVVVSDGSVNVAAGTYDETVAIGTGLDNLTLQGAGPANTVISNGLKLDTSAGDLTGLSVSSLALKGNAGTYGEGVTVGHIGNGYVYDLSFDNVLFDGEEVVGMAAYINPLAGTFSFTNGEITGYEDWGVLYLGHATLNAGPDGPSLTTVTVEGNNIHHNKGSSVVYGNKDNFTDLFVLQNNDGNNNGGHAWFWAIFELRNVDNIQVEGNDFDGAPVGMEDVHGAALYLTNDNNGLFNGDITYNNFTNNWQAIYVYSGDVSGLQAHFNNFVGNDIAIDARGEADPTGTMDATNNWWGHASGPIPPGTYESYGDKVSDNVDYEPWLLETVTDLVPEPPTFDKTLALKDGWTLVSTDKAVAVSDWVGTEPLVEELPDKIMAYKYTSGFVPAAPSALGPLTAIYVKTKGGGGIGFNYAVTETPTMLSKDLEAGWNLISIPSTIADTGAILSPLRYVTVGTQQVVGLTTLVSQDEYNQFSGSFYDATLTDADWDSLKALNPFDGYWANMEAADTFEVVPD